MKVLINSIESEISDSSLQKIGQGGEGVIYLITLNGEKYAIKKYYKPNENLHKKVKAMLDRAPNDSVQKINSQTFIQLAWPIGLCYDGSSFCGFVMPYVDLKHTNTLDFYLDPRLFKEKFGVGNLSLTFKIEIARNLAGVVKLLHSKGHFFIDFKPQNVRVYDRYHLISLIDCDGFSIEGATGERFQANGYSSEYIYPEALQKNKRPQELSLKQDLFALSVVIFQLMNYGIHPFSGIIGPGDTATTTDDKVTKGYYPYGLSKHSHIKPLGSSIHNYFPENLRKLFDRAFVADSSYPPLVDEWIVEFEKIITQQDLQKCKKNPTKSDHIHFSGHECMACKREELTPNIKINTPNFKASASSAKSYTNIAASSTATSKPFWNSDKFWGFGGILLLAFLIHYGLTNEQSSPKSTNTTSAESKSAITSNTSNLLWGKLQSVPWATDNIECSNYWMYSLNNGQYTFNIRDTKNSTEDFTDVIYSFTALNNYQLDSGKVLKSVMRFETSTGTIDIFYNDISKPEIKLIRFEDKDGNLLVSQGIILKTQAPTGTRKRCF